MDANALLAIYTKVQQIFNTGDSKFLSFPLDFQFIFSPESLSLLFENDAATAVSYLNQRADFSRVMNRPVKSLFPSSDTGDLLWDVYKGILTSAEIAEDSLSEAEKEAFQRAEDFLFDQDENGLTVPSEKYRQYAEFRDRSFTYEEQIANLRMSETLTEGERNLELAKLKKAQAENDELWSAGGLRQEVEKHLEFREKVLASSPLTAWARMKDKCQSDLSIQTDLTGASFATTFLFPSNVLSQPWCTIQVGKEEVSDLLRHASSEIKQRLNSDYNDPIESFSFEYRSVGVQRPWFDSSLFKSRLWRLPDSAGQMISYGSDKLLGRFPAYISALLLMRHFRIEYASGKTVTSFGTLSSNQEGSDREVSVLAYICKRIPVSPNPDEGVQWPTNRKTAALQLQQAAGGTIHAYIGGEEVDSGVFSVGTKVKVKAVADPSCILRKWKVNEAYIDNLDYSYECVLEEKGLTITPLWEYGETLDPAHVKIRKDTLLSVDKGPAILDMNRISDLCQIKVIGEKAFRNYANLTSITIGKSVEIIGEQVFPNCANLEKVFIPPTTRSIHKRAFVRDQLQEDPFIWIDRANESYTSLGGDFTEKWKTLTAEMIPCSCGAKYVFSGQAPAVCPRCGAALDASQAKKHILRQPDAKVPFRVTEQEARDLVRQFFAQEHALEPAFKKLATQADLPLKPVYVPLWEWRIQAESGLQEGSPAPATAARDAMVALPASKIVGDEVIDTNDFYTEKFSFERAPAGTAFELYTQGVRECQMTRRTLILDSLRKTENPSPDVNYVSQGTRLLYNPLWIGSLEYKGASYPFHVDGYSRKVTFLKDAPKDRKRPWIIAGCILAGLALVALGVLLFLGVL